MNHAMQEQTYETSVILSFWVTEASYRSENRFIVLCVTACASICWVIQVTWVLSHRLDPAAPHFNPIVPF